MGAFNRVKPPVTIQPKDAAEAKLWGWDEYEQIIISTQTTTADLDAIAYGQERGTATQSICRAVIVDWNLLDINGMKLPVNPATIALLPPEYSMRVLMEATQYLNGGISQAEAQAFTVSATAPTQTS